MTAETLELSSFFEETELDRDTQNRYAQAAYASFKTLEQFETLAKDYQQKVEQGQGNPLKLALAWFILGRFNDALAWFEKAPASPLRHYHAAEAAIALHQYDTALSQLQNARQQGHDSLEVDMRTAQVHLRQGQLDKASELVNKHEHDGQDRAIYHLLRGMISEAHDERETALEAFQKAVTLEPENEEICFCCARLYDLCGVDTEALHLYDSLSERPRAHVNALMNAAVIYEDYGRYDEAANCLRRVLKAFPNHTRARLYLKDVESCQEMMIDDTGDDRVDARARLLETPLSEYELSVRARNCLKKMNIRTVGELMNLTEAELLAYKNFGETSLNEIKALLSKKGLRLGQGLDEITIADAGHPTEESPPAASVPPGQEAILSKPVTDLELSVRARRCLQRLNIQSLSDLIQFSESDLLSTRNFGVTSLNEIKARLGEHGLQLAPKKAT